MRRRAIQPSPEPQREQSASAEVIPLPAPVPATEAPPEPAAVPVTDTKLPPDLVPIPSGGWAKRPLEVEIVRTALWLTSGNIERAAEKLKCEVSRLAAFVYRYPVLKQERDLARGLIVDRAESVVLEGLEDKTDPVRRDDTARFVLNTLGKHAGWGELKQPQGSVALTSPQGGTVTVRWGDEGPDAA